MLLYQAMRSIVALVFILTPPGAWINAEQRCLVSSSHNNNHCSSNTACACLELPDRSNQRDLGVCALSPLDCSELTPCDETFSCTHADTICVRDARCPSRPICYSLSWTTSTVCPPRTSTKTVLVENDICQTATWSSAGKTVAGGHGPGSALDQLNNPFGLVVDRNDNDSLIIVDNGNGRVMRWVQGASSGTQIAGGNGAGNRSDQLALPRYVTVDDEGTLFITEYTNKRVNRWTTGAQTGEIIISNISVNGIALGPIQNGNQDLFVGDWYEARILKFDKNGTGTGKVIIGGEGPGSSLEQLITPYQMHVDRQGSIFVPEYSNNRVTKWTTKNYDTWEKSATIVAGGNSNGSQLNQLDGTLAVIVDQSGTVYAADYGNHRIIRWRQGATSGVVIAGGNGQGNLSTQLNHPYDLAFDRHGNLYVSDFSNHRIQMFTIDTTSCSSGAASHFMNSLPSIVSFFCSLTLIFYASVSLLI